MQWFGGESDTGADAARQLEFTQIASIAAAAGDGAFRVRDRNNDWRDSTFADVAVLMKSRTGIDRLEDAFVRENVLYVFDGQAPLFTSQDVRDLHACLTAIDDPSDQVAVLSALRSPAFSCPDTDLLKWKQAGGGFGYLTSVNLPDPGSVTAAFKELRHFHRMSREVNTSTLIERFVRARRLREKTTLTRLGPERRRRLDLVVELASTLSDSDSMTLREFTRWLARQSEENARMPERVSQGAPAGAVRVMTIHGAKGLEFPIVILASATGGSPNRESVQLRTHKDLTGESHLEVQLGGQGLGIATSGAADAMELEKADGTLEDVRLMYVAATRARDHLLVSRHRGKRGSGSLAAKIEQHLEGYEDLWREWSQPAVVQRPVVQSAGERDTAEARSEWISHRAEVVANASLSGYTTPTALKPGKAVREAMPKEPSEGLDEEPGRSGRGATEIGRAVHAVLQYIDLIGWTDDDLASLSERMAEEHGIGTETSQVAELARAALVTGTMKRAADAAKRGEAWREVSVAAALDDGVGELEGQIDLLFREDDGSLTVVDYKTDRLAGRDRADAAAPYLLQMGGYAWCVERVNGAPVDRAVLIFARATGEDGSGEYEVSGLAALKQQAALMAADRVSAPVNAG